MSYKGIYEVIKSKGYRMTPQRKSVIETLLEEADYMLTVEQLHEKVLLKNEQINLSTVYRNLELLEEIGQLFVITDEERIKKYKMKCTHHHHHHFICNICGKTEVVDYCPIDSIREVAKEQDFEVMSHHLEIYGICSQCGKKHKPTT